MIINTTPHSIVIVSEKGKSVIPETPYKIRVNQKEKFIEKIENIPIYDISFSQLDIPDVVIDHLNNGGKIITSKITAEAFKEKKPEYFGQIFIPARTIKDDTGKIIGTIGLVRYY